MSAAGLYRHFENKEKMFEALVLPAVSGIKELVRSVNNSFGELPGTTQREIMKNAFDNKESSEEPEASEEDFSYLTEYIYDHYDAFKLLLTCSDAPPTQTLFMKLREFILNTP